MVICGEVNALFLLVDSQVSALTPPAPAFIKLQDRQIVQNPNHMTTSDDPQSPQTLNPTDPTEDDQENPLEVEVDEEEEEEQRQQLPNEQPNEEEGKSSSLLSPTSQQTTDTHVVVTTMTQSAKRSSSRRGGGGGSKKRKRYMRPKAVEALRKKFQTLVQNLKPIPFKPKKTLDFLSHEKLLRRLGLWEFVHLELECNNIRTDLIAQLIVGFDRKNRQSEVNGVKIKVSRADLARALRLPLPVKGVTSLGVNVETDIVDVSSKESIGFVNDLVSNWMVLHEEMWMGPPDVFNWTKMIEEGLADKVEWASLVWFMVERELSQGQNLGQCYYASHLQYLMKCQCEKLFLEDPKVEVDSVKVDDDEDLDGDEQANPEEESEDASLLKMESEDDIDAPAVIEHEENGGGVSINCNENAACLKTTEIESDEKMGDVDAVVNESKGDVEMTEVECDGNVIESEAEMNRNETGALQQNKLEELSVELTLGKDDSEKELDKGGNPMTLDECRVDSAVKFSFDTHNSMSEHFLQPCSFDMIDRSLNVVVEGKQEEDEEPEEQDVEEQDLHNGGFNLYSKHISLQEMASSNLMQAPDFAQGPYSSSVQLHNQSPAGYHTSRGETSTAIFGTSKRSIDHDGSEVTHEQLNGTNKRLRSNGPWDDDKVFDYETCMMNVHHFMQNTQHWMEKARIAKESECENLTMNNQHLLEQLQQRNNAFEHLQRSKYDMHQKSQVEIYRLERELFVMGDILKSYQKALKENNRTFREYRARYQVREEPFYKDVPGSGGLVLSVTELEKQRLEKEEEERIKTFEDRVRGEEEDRIRREEDEAIRRGEEDRIKMEEENRVKRMQIEMAAKKIETEFTSKWESHLNRVDILSGRITGIEKDVKVVKDAVAMKKASSELVRSPDETSAE